MSEHSPAEADRVETCDMTYTAPMDFAQCNTHDTTFPLGEACRFQGRVMWEVFAEEADAQRAEKVRAQMELDDVVRVAAELRARLRPLGAPADSPTVHVPIGLDEHGQGPAEEADVRTVECWTCMTAWPCPAAGGQVPGEDSQAPALPAAAGTIGDECFGVDSDQHGDLTEAAYAVVRPRRGKPLPAGVTYHDVADAIIDTISNWASMGPIPATDLGELVDNILEEIAGGDGDADEDAGL